MPKTKSVPAVEGDIQYDTFTCRNCQHDFLEEDVISVYLDVDVSDTDCVSRRHNCKNVKVGERTNLCENCAESIFNYNQNKRGAFMRKARNWFDKIHSPFDWVLVIILGYLLAIFAYLVFVAAI